MTLGNDDFENIDFLHILDRADDLIARTHPEIRMILNQVDRLHTDWADSGCDLRQWHDLKGRFYESDIRHGLERPSSDQLRVAREILAGAMELDAYCTRRSRKQQEARKKHGALGQVAARKVTAQAAKSTRGWRKVAPKLISARRALFARCGAGAFLVPETLAFPIMAKTGPCVIDCRGLRAAKARAAQYGHTAVVRAADRLAQHAACRWAP